MFAIVDKIVEMGIFVAVERERDWILKVGVDQVDLQLALLTDWD